MYPFTDLEPGTAALVLDELTSPVLATANEEQLEGLKDLVSLGNPIV
jgi:hypothetical protein